MACPHMLAVQKGQPKGLIVIVPDAFGWTFVNSRVLADQCAKKGGYLVYIPEFMNGY
jgi:dienelactone hydrolase